MNQKDAQLFIDEMKSIGDEWTFDQVMDIYGHTSLAVALSDRKNSINMLSNILDKVINR